MGALMFMLFVYVYVCTYFNIIRTTFRYLRMCLIGCFAMKFRSGDNLKLIKAYFVIYIPQ